MLFGAMHLIAVLVGLMTERFNSSVFMTSSRSLSSGRELNVKNIGAPCAPRWAMDYLRSDSGPLGIGNLT